MLFPVITFAKVFNGKVVSIHDGDTLRVVLDNESKSTSVRFIGIDTPEIDFHNYSQGKLAFEARDYLRELIPLESKIQIITYDKTTDRNLRLLGTIFYNGTDINYELLKEGLAVMYFISPFDKKLFNKYRGACIEASTTGKGIYDPSNETMLPYEWRMSIQKRIGTNYVLDVTTNKLYAPGTYSHIHSCNRSFQAPRS